MAEPNLGLMVVAAAFLAAPFVYMVLIETQLRTFQREAFGLFRSAARWLRVSVAAIFCYYIAMVTWLSLSGRVERMIEWVITAEGLRLYLRIGGAALAFGLHWMVSLQLYRIVRPTAGQQGEQGARDAPDADG